MKKANLFALLILAVAIVSFSSIAYSKESYTDDFNTYYGTNGVKDGSTLGSCITCHNSTLPTNASDLNSYGLDFFLNSHDFGAIEQMDSDDDGYDNDIEIYANSFPGDPDIVPTEQTNNPPTANAGPDQTVRVGETVTLDGSGSQDVDGDALAWTWSFESTPAGSSPVLSSTTAVKPTFVAEVPGSYVVKLIVDDGLDASAPDTVTISTQNSAPLADAGANQTVSVGEAVTLDGSGSSDPDGDNLTFSWSIASQPPASSAALSDNTALQPSFTVDQPGTYDVKLIVNDGTLDSDPDTVTVSTGNLAPVADAGADQAAHVGQTITLDGSKSQDANGDPLNFVWSFASVPTGSKAALSDPTSEGPSFVVDLTGNYVVQLIVNDGKVDSPADTVSISTENSTPIADAGRRRNARVGDTVTIDGSQSTDPDGDPLTFSWSIVSQPEGSSTVMAAAPSAPTGGDSSTYVFVPDVPGSYVVQLIVNDGTVNSEAATCTVRVRKQNQRGNKGKGGPNAKGFSSRELDAGSGSDFQNSEHETEDEHEREYEHESD